MTEKRKRLKTELLTRTLTFSSVHPRLYNHAIHKRGHEPEITTGCSIVLRGVLDEAVRKVMDIEVLLYPVDEIVIGTARPASVGAIVAFRPELQLVVAFDQRDFDR